MYSKVQAESPNTVAQIAHCPALCHGGLGPKQLRMELPLRKIMGLQ